jgi:hypothetical protein
MRIREAIPLVLLLPVFGFIGWQVLDQTRDAETERAATVVSTAPLDDSAQAAPPAAPPAAAPEPSPAEEPAHPVFVSPGSSNPNAIPAPERDVMDVRRRITLYEKGTYIEEILIARDSGLARWPERVAMPLHVWVQNGAGIAGWNDRYPEQVREAFETWALTGVPMKFSYVRDSLDADVMVLWIDRFDTQITGRTLWSRDKNWWIVSGSITLALHHTGGEPLDERAIHAIALHEVGHLLGLDHSNDTLNIMTARVRVHELTDADRATMKLLYALPPGSLKN